MVESDLSMGDLDLAIKEFLVESRENLLQLDLDLVTIERAPDDRESLESIFLTIHTIRGTCCFFDFARLEALAHGGETLIHKLRYGALAWNRAIASALRSFADIVREILDTIERRGVEDDADYSQLLAQFASLCAVLPGSGVASVAGLDTEG
jgi:two-component system, chemotaxis family, sensor kinase CheA